MANTLIIDLDEAATQPLIKTLRELGHDVAAIADHDHLSHAPAAGADVLFIDVTNPAVDAYALVRELRVVTPGLRVCAYADRATKNDLVAVLRAGFNDWLDKPPNAAEVEAALARLLSAEAPEAAACPAATWADGGGVGDVIQMLRSGTIDLPQMPAVARKLRKLLTDPEVTGAAVVALLEQDPSLCARVLSYANGAAFCGSISSLQEAVFRLGLGRIRSLVETAALASTFTAPSPALQARFRDLWQGYVLSATVARRLADGAGVDPEEAYLMALFRDVGELFLLGVMAKVGADAADAVLLQLDEWHPKFSASLLARWGLGDRFQAVARQHHEATYEGDTERVRLLNILHYAEHLTHAHLPNLRRQPPAGPGSEAARVALDITPEADTILLEAMGEMEAEVSVGAG